MHHIFTTPYQAICNCLDQCSGVEPDSSYILQIDNQGLHRLLYEVRGPGTRLPSWPAPLPNFTAAGKAAFRAQADEWWHAIFNLHPAIKQDNPDSRFALHQNCWQYKTTPQLTKPSGGHSDYCLSAAGGCSTTALTRMGLTDASTG